MLRPSQSLSQLHVRRSPRHSRWPMPRTTGQERQGVCVLPVVLDDLLPKQAVSPRRGRWHKIRDCSLRTTDSCLYRDLARSRATQPARPTRPCAPAAGWSVVHAATMARRMTCTWSLASRSSPCDGPTRPYLGAPTGSAYVSDRSAPTTSAARPHGDCSPPIRRRDNAPAEAPAYSAA